jgi:hypothetical protein
MGRRCGGDSLKPSGDMADELHVSFRLAADDERLTLWQPAKQDKAALVVLNKLDTIARAAAAAKLGGGTDGGMGEHENASRRGKVFSRGGQ